MPADPLAALFAIGPFTVALCALISVEWNFRHPVAKRFMQLGIIISMVLTTHLLLEWAVDVGLIEYQTTNMTSVEACT